MIFKKILLVILQRKALYKENERKLKKKWLVSGSDEIALDLSLGIKEIILLS